jgi:hypothetical protein
VRIESLDATEFVLTARPCPACGSTDFERLWARSFTAETRTEPRRFDVRVVLCLTCAFVLASPAPEQADLDRYYADSLAAWEGQELDYSVESRIALLDRHRLRGRRVVEVGGAASGRFREALEKRFDDCVAVQPNTGQTSEEARLADIARGSADAVVHYYVLEHVRDVVGHLRACAEILAPGGTMVCEVPDLDLYPLDASALALYEHQNHFNPDSLDRVAGQVGLQVVDVSHAFASRPFGFVAVLRRRVTAAEPVPHHLALLQARSRVFAGLRLIDRQHRQLLEARRVVEAACGAHRPAILWAANDLLRDFLDLTGPLPDGVVVVDSDPSKSSIRGIAVRAPEEACSALADAAALVVFAELHSAAIIDRALELGAPVALRSRAVVVPDVRAR